MTEEDHLDALSRVGAVEATARGGSAVIAAGTVAWGAAMLAPAHVSDRGYIPGQALDLLSVIPGWPRAVALTAIIAGSLLLVGLVTGRRRCAVVGAVGQMGIWASYAGLFLVGTIQDGGIWGPCVIYVVLAACSSLILNLVQQTVTRA